MTLAHADQCSESTARALTDQLRQSLAISWELLVEAYQRRAWAALGYESWDAYTDAELGETRLRLPREQRREVVQSMTEAGMSVRAIGSALGVSKNTVTADQVSQTGTPDEVVDAELVDEPDEVGDRIARELAASDDAFAEQAAKPENRVQGTDGKSYPAAQPQQPRRKALTDAFWTATYDMTKAVERVERLADDDRFPQNAEKVAAIHRSDLIRAIDALQGVVNRLPSA